MLNLEIERAIKLEHEKKLKKLLIEAVSTNDISVLPKLKEVIYSNHSNGLVLSKCTEAYFRLSRKSKNDCEVLFELAKLNEHTISESLLDVLGYDKVLPTLEEQMRIISMFYHFGDGIDLRYFSDPRYGLAAACAGWDKQTVRMFLEYCVAIPDVPLQYVAKHSLEGKYIRLR
jgi:hypothetical protein